MKKPIALLLFTTASVASAAAFADLPDKKQKHPGVACPGTGSGEAGGPAGMAITEEGGPIQHADRPKPKGKGMAMTGSGGSCPGPGPGPGPDCGAAAGAGMPPAGMPSVSAHAINTKGTGATGRMPAPACPAPGK
jgi:hypothetical protein